MSNGDLYRQYALIYVDDVLYISHNPKPIVAVLEAKYTLKEGSVGSPTDPLGAANRKWNVEGADEPDKARWAMSSDKIRPTCC